VDGGVGDKKVYDPRSYLRAAQASMSERVVQACRDLTSVGKTLAG
jgi:fructose-bisphosphate aldolase class II